MHDKAVCLIKTITKYLPMSLKIFICLKDEGEKVLVQKTALWRYSEVRLYCPNEYDEALMERKNQSCKYRSHI